MAPREPLRVNGNLSNMADPPTPGSCGPMIAMGPTFCSELALLGW